MPNTDPAFEPTRSSVTCPASGRRKQLHRRRMRRLQRLLEIASIIVHLYIIGDAFEHAFVWATAVA